jgi:putative ABC transport system permease protein
VAFFEARGSAALRELASIDGVRLVEPKRNLAVRFENGHLEERGALTGMINDPELERVMDMDGNIYRIPEAGAVISSTLADILRIRAGDSLAIEVLEDDRRHFSVTVAAVIETNLGKAAFIHIDHLARLMGRDSMLSGAVMAIQDDAEAAVIDALRGRPEIAAVTTRRSIIARFEETLAETVDVIVGFYVLFSSLLTFGVVYNAARIALSERDRELASLRVLGFRKIEIGYLLLGEIALLTLIAIPLGCVLGHYLAIFITATMDNELYRIPITGEPFGYGFSIVISLLAASLAGLLVARRLNRLDLIAVLKTRE